jgi:hypothetical protein
MAQHEDLRKRMTSLPGALCVCVCLFGKKRGGQADMKGMREREDGK